MEFFRVRVLKSLLLNGPPVLSKLADGERHPVATPWAVQPSAIRRSSALTSKVFSKPIDSSPQASPHICCLISRPRNSALIPSLSSQLWTTIIISWVFNAPTQPHKVNYKEEHLHLASLHILSAMILPL